MLSMFWMSRFYLVFRFHGFGCHNVVKVLDVTILSQFWIVRFYLSFWMSQFYLSLDATILSQFFWMPRFYLRILRASESTIRLNVVDSKWMNYFRCLISITNGASHLTLLILLAVTTRQDTSRHFKNSNLLICKSFQYKMVFGQKPRQAYHNSDIAVI